LKLCFVVKKKKKPPLQQLLLFFVFVTLSNLTTPNIMKRDRWVAEGLFSPPSVEDILYENAK